MQALSAANRTSHGQSKIYNNNCSSCNPQAMNLTWNPGESRSGLTQSNLLACRRCLGPDLLSRTDGGFQGNNCNSPQTPPTVAGAEGGLCDSRGELETDLWCSWAGLKWQIFLIFKTFTILKTILLRTRYRCTSPGTLAYQASFAWLQFYPTSNILIRNRSSSIFSARTRCRSCWTPSYQTTLVGRSFLLQEQLFALSPSSWSSF